jgi:hypothetical protein
MRHWHVPRALIWLTLMALSLTAACDVSPTAPCFDLTDSGACTRRDSTHTSNLREPTATSAIGLVRPTEMTRHVGHAYLP